MNFDFTDKIAIISGGTHGIGQAIALKLADYGCKIAVCSRSKTNLEKTKKLLQNKSTDHFVKKVDVLNIKQIVLFVKDVKKKYGKIDFLINNVGGDGGTLNKSIVNSNIKHWNEIYDLNVKSSIVFSKHSLPVMKKNKFGRIIFISSISSKKFSGLPWYIIAKKAEITLMKTFSVNRDFVRNGITFNSISPGAIMIPKTNWGNFKKNNLKKFNKLLDEKFPMGRLGTVHDISNIVVFLCSKYSSFINGSDIVVDGGQSNENYED